MNKQNSITSWNHRQYELDESMRILWFIFISNENKMVLMFVLILIDETENFGIQAFIYELYIVLQNK